MSDFVFDFSDFSLLYPDAATMSAHHAGTDTPRIDDFTLEELGLPEVLPLKNSRLSDFVTENPAVIRYRQEIFADMLENEQIGKTISRLVPILFDIMELRRLQNENGDTADYLSGMTEIELYISSIDVLYHGLCEEKNSFKGKAFIALRDTSKTWWKVNIMPSSTSDLPS